MSAPISFDSVNSIKGISKAHKLLGLALAGGKSIRMGTDKALVEVEGKTFLSITKALLDQSGVDQIVVSSNKLDGAMRDQLLDCGPLGALYSLQTLDEIKHFHAVIVCPIDMPLMRADLINVLVGNSLKNQCASYFKNHPMPFCFIINDSFFTVLNTQIKNKHFSVKELLKRLGAMACRLPKNSENNFNNVNTPEQLALVNAQ